MNIPVVHVQGGEVTGSIDEKVRHAVTKLSDVHLVSTEKAASRLIRMGEEPSTVFVTGCPSVDLAKSVICDPAIRFDPYDKYGGVGPRVDLSREYIVVMQHPVTTEYEQAREHVDATLDAIHSTGMPALWFWPNVDAGSDGTSSGIRAFREHEPDANIHFFKNMAPTDFLRVLYNSRCLVGNSSVGIRECAYLGVPVVNIGSRQSGRDRGGNVIDVGYDSEAIGDALEHHLNNGGRYPSDPIYGDGKAGVRIADTLATTPLHIEKRLCY
jgi:UDP-hydrolysing UDP-N-acetyl-D-glucosamine 2-epimerase